ncbi:hypothetical protein LARI1_G005997 [Lachnellula arida]|uniref:Heterokaryon incompatibility domain-containing protein n=1 Tax=Lachnellula arida TaxID=1316785 RepID=A0A8T9BFI4_9HELO|nr:hypothetical protein LARI1_G005997 [Lachnellula arida]
MSRDHAEHVLFGDEEENQNLSKDGLYYGKNGVGQDGDIVATELESDDERKHDNGKSRDEHIHEIGEVSGNFNEEESDNESGEGNESESGECSENESSKEWDDERECVIHPEMRQKDREHGLKIIEGLLRKMEHRPISTKVIKAAAEDLHGDSSILALLVRHNNTVPVHEEIVKTVARNPEGHEMMEFLLHYQDGLGNTEDVMIAAAMVKRNGRRQKVSQKLPIEALLRGRPHIRITENTLITAAENEDFGHDVVALLLQHRNNTDITEKVLIAAVKNDKRGLSITRELLSHQSVTVTSATIQAAMENYHATEMVEMLIAHGSNSTIGEDIMEQAYARQDEAPGLVDVLLQFMGDSTQRHHQDHHASLDTESNLTENCAVQADATACATCLELEFRSSHEIVMKDLLRTSPSCWGCSLIRKCTDFIIETAEEKLEPYSDIRIDLDWGLHTSSLCMKLSTPYSGYANPSIREFYRHPDLPIISPRIGIAGDIQASAVDCMMLANDWLQDCTNNHNDCPRYLSPLPTRVINVGSVGTEPFLHVSSGEVARYTALSHCWGTGPTCVTTKDTLEARKQAIPLHILSKTFQDAITITRQLGITYLWIDSLCIVQDDDEDWSREGANMSNVYRNSTVTILADGVPNHDGGCSAPLDTGTVPFGSLSEGIPPFRSLARNVSKPIRCVNKDGVECHVYGRIHMSKGSQVAHVKHFHDHWSRLNSRGWTLQERILAPRKIHYTPDEIAWECTTQQCCECSPTPVAVETTDNLRLIQRDTGLSIIDRSTQWHDLVDEFTSRTLSQGSDRLPAISGLAGLMRFDSEDEYVCGLWRNNLARELLWMVPSDLSLDSRRHEKYYAPSWL